MRRIVVDTNAFVRFLLDDIREQKKRTEELFQQAKHGEVQLVVPQIVIFEIAFTLLRFYKVPKQTIVKSLKVMLNIPYLEIQDRNTFQLAVNMYDKENHSLADCFILIKAKEENAELFTFDQKLQKLL